MDHNFVWTSKEVEGAPEYLFAGVEFIDGHMSVTNLNPNKEEYYMGDQAMNPEFDCSTITADWFHAEMKVEKDTSMNVYLYDPSTEKPAEADMTRWANLQITDAGNFYLEIYTAKSLVDPMMLLENRH